MHGFDVLDRVYLDAFGCEVAGFGLVGGYAVTGQVGLRFAAGDLLREVGGHQVYVIIEKEMKGTKGS